MDRLINVNTTADIPQPYRNTAVGLLLEYQNLGRPLDTCSEAQILVGMCMDNRKHLRIPDNFAYIIRSGGGNLRHSEFKVSYAVAVGKVQAIVLIMHDACGMANLFSQRQQFIDGLVEAGWQRQYAEEHFNQFAPLFAIGNVVDFALSEAQRLRQRYPRMLVAPMYYQLETNKLCLIRED